MIKLINKKFICFILIVSFISHGYAAIVSDNDGSAFVTKAEFDALKASFNKQIDDYNASIDGKIDGAIASYLSGIKLASTEQRQLLCSAQDDVTCLNLKTTSGGYGDDGYVEYKYALSGLHYIDYVVYSNLKNTNTTGVDHRKYYSTLITRDKEDIHKICVRNLVKGNTTTSRAIWDGFTENATEMWTSRNIWWSQDGTKVGAATTGYYICNYNNSGDMYWTGTPDYSKQVGRFFLQLEGTDGSNLSDTGSYRDVILDYGNKKYTSAIIWKPISENKFITTDEILGFGNLFAKDGTNRPQVKDLVSHITQSGFYQTQGTATRSDVSYDGPPINPNDYLTYNTNRSKSFPGERWANSYIINWSQIQTDFYGKSYTTTGEYLSLYNGVPFISVGNGELVSYDMLIRPESGTFDAGDKYKLIASIGPFNSDNTTSSPIKISLDNVNFEDSVTITPNTTTKIYFDFETINPLSGSSTNLKNVFIKWTKVNGTTVYNGGGQLVLDSEDKKIANITKNN